MVRILRWTQFFGALRAPKNELVETFSAYEEKNNGVGGRQNRRERKLTMTKTISEIIAAVTDAKQKESLLEDFSICGSPTTTEDVMKFMFGPTPMGEDSSARAILSKTFLPDAPELLLKYLPQATNPFKREWGYRVFIEHYRNFGINIPEAISAQIVSEVKKDIVFEASSQEKYPLLVYTAIQALGIVAIFTGFDFRLPDDFPKLLKTQEEAFSDSLSHSLKGFYPMRLKHDPYIFYIWSMIGVCEHQLKPIFNS